MAKRANPYLEDFVPQSKTHVGIKQFNNNVERLQEVYEKTLQMLFKGAKKPTVSEALQKFENSEATALRGDKKMKQLAIGNNGGLLHHANVECAKKKNMVAPCACGVSRSQEQCQCEYCEVLLCAHCSYVCVRCRRPHCHQCSLSR